MCTSKIVGKNIQRYRLVNDYTLDNIATFLEIDYETLSDFENGIGNLSVINLSRIADLFGVELDELLSENTSSIIDKTHNHTLTDIDIQSIFEFNRIVLNYTKMKRLMGSL